LNIGKTVGWTPTYMPPNTTLQFSTLTRRKSIIEGPWIRESQDRDRDCQDKDRDS